MADLKNLLEYQSLCGVNNKEIANGGGYEKSVQYLGQVLTAKTPLTESAYLEIMRAISIARETKLQEINNNKNKND